MGAYAPRSQNTASINYTVNKTSKDSIKFNEQSDHKVTIHHIPTNTPPIKSYGSRSCEVIRQFCIMFSFFIYNVLDQYFILLCNSNVFSLLI